MSSENSITCDLSKDLSTKNPKAVDVSTNDCDSQDDLDAGHQRTNSAYATDDEEAQLIASLEASSPDLNLLTSFTDDDASPLDDSSMYGTFFEDSVYAASCTGGSGDTSPRRPRMTAQTPLVQGTIMERHLASVPSPYRWWSSTNPQNTGIPPNYAEEPSDMTNANLSYQQSSAFQVSPHCHRPSQPTLLNEYSSHATTGAILLDESNYRPSSLTATVTFSEVPRSNFQTIYGIPRMTSSPCLHPVGSQPPHYRMMPSTIIQKATEPYSTDEELDSTLLADDDYFNSNMASSNTIVPDINGPVCQRSCVATSVADSFKNMLRENAREKQHNLAADSGCSLGDPCHMKQSGWPDSHPWLNSYRTSMPSATSTTATAENSFTPLCMADEEEPERVSQTLSFDSKEALCHNYDAFASTSSASMCGDATDGQMACTLSAEKSTGGHSGNIIASQMENANSLFELRKRNEKANSILQHGKNIQGIVTSTSSAQFNLPTSRGNKIPVTTTTQPKDFAVPINCEVQSLGVITPTNIISSVQLPSFATQFGSCTRCVDATKKRKSSTVRELLEERSKQKLLAVQQPTACSSAPVEMLMPKPSHTQTSQQLFPSTLSLLGSNQQPQQETSISFMSGQRYPNQNICSPPVMTLQPVQPSVQPISTNSFETRGHNAHAFQQHSKINICPPVANIARNSTPENPQLVPIFLVQNVPQVPAGDRQVITNWQILLQGPVVRTAVPQNVANLRGLPIEGRQNVSMTQGPTVMQPQGTQVSQRTSLLREALSRSTVTVDCGSGKSQTKTVSSSPTVFPMDSSNRPASSCIMSLLKSTQAIPHAVPPPPLPQSSSKKRKSDILNFRPQHYEMDMLHIGTFLVSQPLPYGRKSPNKFKVLFNKRKFVYEFQVNDIPLVDHNPSTLHMAAIDVPFHTVSAIHCNKYEIMVSVTQPPTLYLTCKFSNGCDSPYDRARQTDITGGQLRTNHLHKVYLKKCQAEILSASLEKFDPLFITMMQTPILELVEVQSKSTIGKSNRTGNGLEQKRQCATDVSQSPDASTSATAKEVTVCILCHCQVSCRSNRCSCMKARIKCGRDPSRCMCRDCDNPLNTLDMLGFCIKDCAADICLIHNIVAYKGDLKEFVDRAVKFPCCNTEVQVKDCIPGKVRCPNSMCSRIFKYSWCDDELQDEETEPRNHCSLCRACQDCIDLHCSACRRCNPMKTYGSSKCPDCSGPLDTSYTEIQDIANVLLLLGRQDDRDRAAPSTTESTVEVSTSPELARTSNNNDSRHNQLSVRDGTASPGQHSSVKDLQSSPHDHEEDSVTSSTPTNMSPPINELEI